MPETIASRFMIDDKGAKHFFSEGLLPISMPDTGTTDYKWFEACREIKADWTSPAGKTEKIEITEKTIDDFIRNFYDNVRGLVLPNSSKPTIPLDFEHGDDVKYGKDGAGWVGEMAKGEKVLENGKSVKTLLIKPAEYTPVAQEAIRSGAKRFPSIVFNDWKNPETGKQYRNVLFACTLTNEPFVKGLTPIQLTEQPAEKVDSKKTLVKEKKMKALREMLSKAITLSEDASDELVVFHASAQIKALSEVKDAITIQLTESNTKLTEATKKLSEMNEQLKAYKLAEAEFVKKELVTICAGKISPAIEKDEKSWFNIMLSEGKIELLKSIVKDMPVLFKDKAKAKNELEEEDAELKEMKGKKFDELTGAQKEKLTKAHMAENPKMKYSEAAEAVAKKFDEAAIEKAEEELEKKEEKIEKGGK